MTEWQLLAGGPCGVLSECLTILKHGKRVFVIGHPAELPTDAPAGVGPGEAVVAIPADLLDQAVHAELNRLAHEAAHWQDLQDLRDQLAELRARQST